MVGQIGGRTEGEEEEEEVSEDVRPEDTRAGRRVLSIEYRVSGECCLRGSDPNSKGNRRQGDMLRYKYDPSKLSGLRFPFGFCLCLEVGT